MKDLRKNKPQPQEEGLDQNEQAHTKWQKQKEQEFIKARQWVINLMGSVAEKIDQTKQYPNKEEMRQGYTTEEVYKNIQIIQDYLNLPF